jgi:hypothetical protein
MGRMVFMPNMNKMVFLANLKNNVITKSSCKIIIFAYMDKDVLVPNVVLDINCW